MKSITKDSYCLPSENIVAREIDGDIIIVPLTSGIGDMEDELYSLNETGKAIWNLLDGENTLEQISRILRKEYNTNEEVILNDIIGIVSELVSRNIVLQK
jgi:hypothetical protein